ncbi:UPF0562 protein C7orf55-like [Oryzias melastigma]|uniref:Protein FMC1 homolog n=1 Tax=Oryzias melastigma TaxID=30732 RepID=A0A834F6J5_ORYME|nr:UPF0562 protein C7orf55-like [Oryzias melastigma]
MAGLASPLRVCRGILKELRAMQGPSYKRSLAYSYIMDQFRKNKVTGERYCRAQQEALHASHTYLCLLASSRNHQALHNLYHRQRRAQPGGSSWPGGAQAPHTARRKRLGELN